jgi:hypothetical protein
MKSGLRILSLTSFLLMGMGSCSTTVEEACRSRIPELQKQFAQATHDVAAISPVHGASRAIASVGFESKSRVFDLTRDQKDQWEDWSESRIKEVQQYLDLVRPRSELRPAMQPITHLANELVAFDGYVERGQLLLMMESLRRVQQDADTAVALVCSKTTQ